MNFSTISQNSMLGKLLRFPLRFIPRETVVRIIQGPLVGKKWIVGASTHGCWLGSYESSKQKRLSQLIKEGDVFFDLGGHVGYYTLLGAHFTGSSGRVFTFEPLPDNVLQIERHLSLNRVANVTLFPFALSNYVGTGAFHLGASSAMGHLSNSAEGSQIMAQVRTLDSLVTDFDIPLPDIMKIDIEGGELSALEGASYLLSKKRPIIFLATHSRDLHYACIRLLQSLNYRIETIDATSIEDTDELIAFPS